MGAMDKVLGMALIGAGAAIFVYYTLWVLVMPFLAEGHWLAPFFPLSHWAGVLLPAVLLVVGLSLAATFIGVVMMRSGKKKSAGGSAPTAKGTKAKKDD